MNADPCVMEYFPATLSEIESDALAEKIETALETRGFGLWAVEVPGVVPFAGFTGLSVPGFAAAFTPCVEIGWRLAREQWSRGYATEAAEAVLRYAFEELGLREVVSFTAVGNGRSRRVMERLGMTHAVEDNFDHPHLPEGHALRRHVLYRVARERWLERVRVQVE